MREPTSSPTWQAVFDDDRCPLGFGSKGAQTPDVADIVRKIYHARLISPELLARFHRSLQVVTYPDRRETDQLLRRMGLDALARKIGVRLDPAEIYYRRGGGLRVIESIAADLLAREHRGSGA